MKEMSDCLVLIVDDTETNIDILIEALGDDYDISVAMDGESALQNIETEKPDIILLDVIMPGMDGYEVCRRLKENKATSEIPVIFLTAMTDADSEAKGRKLGAADYINKPFEIMKVKTTVYHYLSLKFGTIS